MLFHSRRHKTALFYIPFFTLSGPIGHKKQCNVVWGKKKKVLVIQDNEIKGLNFMQIKNSSHVATMNT